MPRPSEVEPGTYSPNPQVIQKKTTIDPVTGQPTVVKSTTPTQQTTTPLGASPWTRPPTPAPTPTPTPTLSPLGRSLWVTTPTPTPQTPTPGELRRQEMMGGLKPMIMVGTTYSAKPSAFVQPKSWAEAGYAQYEGKFGFPDIPAGLTIKEVKEAPAWEPRTGAGGTWGGKSLEIFYAPIPAKSPYGKMGTVAVLPREDFITAGIVTAGIAAFPIGGAFADILLPATAAGKVASWTAGVAFIAKGSVSMMGISQAFKTGEQLFTGQKLSLLTPEEALVAGATGAAFAAASAGFFKVIGKIPAFSVGKYVVSGEKIVGSVAGRAAVMASFGGTTSFVLSGGNVVEAGKGAALAAGFSLGMEGISRLAQHIPIPKLGSLTRPVEIGGETETVTWRGIYLQKGEEAKMLFGKWSMSENLQQYIQTSDIAQYVSEYGFPPPRIVVSKTPEILGHDYNLNLETGAIMKAPTPGEGKGFWPSTSLESAFTIQLMGKLGYPAEVVTDIKQVRGTIMSFQKVQPKTIEEFLPSETRSLSAEAVGAAKQVMQENKGIVELFGKYPAIPQESKAFEYIKVSETGEATSALRITSDIDIALKNVGEQEAIKFTGKMLERIQSIGTTVRVSPEKPTLIEAEVSPGIWAHAIDIKYPGMPSEAGDLSTIGKTWGINIAQKKIKIEGLSSQALGEQLAAKGQSILGFTHEAKTGGALGPVAHRALKDVVDFFQDARTLAEAKGVPLEETFLPRLAARYGATDILATPIESSIPEIYVVSPKTEAPSVYPSIPLMAIFPSKIISPQISAQPRLTAVSPSSFSSVSKQVSSIISQGTPKTSFPSFAPSPSKSSLSELSSSTLFPSISESPSLTPSPPLVSLISLPSAPPSSLFPSLPSYPSPPPTFPSPTYRIPTPTPTTPTPTFPSPSPSPTYPSPSPYPSYPPPSLTYPSPPSSPYYPSYPSYAQPPSKLIPTLFPGGGGDFAKKLFLGKGLWRKRVHPIPTIDQATRNFLGAKRKSVTSQSLSLGLGNIKPRGIKNKQVKSLFGSNKQVKGFFNVKGYKHSRTKKRRMI